MSLLTAFDRQFRQFGLEPGPAIVAVSGGPDSVALLDLLVRTHHDHRLELVVAHVDHGIASESARVAAAVSALAESYGLPCETVALGLGAGAGETLARERRYAWLERLRIRCGAEVIVTAHHADDQVETILMRVLEGSGPAGLAGMAVRRGAIVRPLLPFRREVLARYVLDRGLPVWSDPANTDPRHLRSWLRADVLPGLRARLPEVDARISRLGRQAERDRRAWDASLDELPDLVYREEPQGVSVAAAPLRRYDSRLAMSLLIALARRAGCPLGPRRAERVLALLAHSGSGASAPLGGPWRAELAFDRLVIHAVPTGEEPGTLCLAGSGRARWGRWELHWEVGVVPRAERDRAPVERVGTVAWFVRDELLVRAWQPGDRIHPLGGRGRRLVVRCFQDARIPRHQRAGWPIVDAGGTVVWVPGVCRSDRLIPPEGTEGVRVVVTDA